MAKSEERKGAVGSRETELTEWVCLNGQLISADEARISVFDSSFMQGIGLFETMRAYAGRVFRLERHLARLANSARALGWSIIPEPEVTESHVEQVVQACAGQNTRVRLTVSPGSLRLVEDQPPELTIVATASPGGTYPDEYYQQGVSVLSAPGQQNRFDPTCAHKTTSYFARMASLREAHLRGAFEMLFLTDDVHLAEGAISSVFIVQDGKLLTPPLDTPILPGITRATVIEQALEMKLPVQETALTLVQVKSAAEVFLTNSMMEIMPVALVDGDTIGDGKPGELTRQLAQAYKELVARECGDE